MKSREALKIIEERSMEGHSKKYIYDELFGKVKFRTDLLQLLAMVPEQELRMNYKKYNLLHQLSENYAAIFFSTVERLEETLL